MGWNWDLVLVPSGLLVIFGYHTFFLYRCLKLPHATAIGHHNHCRAAWIERMMQVDPKDRGQALSVIYSNTSAAMSLSSICLVLSSQIGTWIRTSAETVFKSNLIYGDMNESIIAIKHITLFMSFLVGFAAFVQTTRCFVNANFLVTMPNADIPFQPLANNNILVKIGQEMREVGRDIEHHARPHGS
ncbi:uncharacterized protein LOC130755447 [Actinidia eriantha]|uniref:uncharacterized protein LOC130755447 n=1 Tax=Actinidia eriantha TaxID=165200 RepID=UPI00258933B1|nr:uncharacterized protein LOC130755447 [Actinidia eriantha]